MKLPDLRKALRVDVIGPDCSLYEPDEQRADFHKRNGLNGVCTVRVLEEALTHPPASWSFATEVERNAYFLRTGDVGKVAFQEDNKRFYMLSSIDFNIDGSTNVNWNQIKITIS